MVRSRMQQSLAFALDIILGKAGKPSATALYGPCGRTGRAPNLHVCAPFSMSRATAEEVDIYSDKDQLST